MKPNSSTILIIFTAIIVAGAAYWFFFMNTPSEPAIITGIEQNQAQIQFQTLVSELEPVTFETNIFLDARFLALRDLTTTIIDEPLGRIDPFAPVAGMSARK